MRHCAERHRADHKQRVPFPPIDDDEFALERKTGPRPRGPSSALACSASYRSRIYIDALEEPVEDVADTMVKAMGADREKLKDVCVSALRRAGFVVVLRDKAKRDRTAETAKRSAMRAKVRAEKMAQIRAENAKALVPAVEIQADSAL